MSPLPPARNVEVRSLHDDEVAEASNTLADGMCNNPLEVAALRQDPEHRRTKLARLFRQLLTLPHQDRTGCFQDGRLIGVRVAFTPTHCRTPTVRTARLGLIVLSFGPLAAQRMARWQLAWRRRDPPESHNHLALLAVRTDAQRQGFGRQLLAEYCRGLDEQGKRSYLETDKAENLAFYGARGFVVVGQADVLGVPNWFLRRDPIGPGGDRTPAEVYAAARVA